MIYNGMGQQQTVEVGQDRMSLPIVFILMNKGYKVFNHLSGDIKAHEVRRNAHAQPDVILDPRRLARRVNFQIVGKMEGVLFNTSKCG